VTSKKVSVCYLLYKVDCRTNRRDRSYNAHIYARSIFNVTPVYIRIYETSTFTFALLFLQCSYMYVDNNFKTNICQVLNLRMSTCFLFTIILYIPGLLFTFVFENLTLKLSLCSAEQSCGSIIHPKITNDMNIYRSISHEHIQIHSS